MPSHHDTKFDRQMRLWGEHGQTALEDAHVLVLGANSIATEVLKNLVLPNIGEFTMVDDALVNEADLGANFFVSPHHIGLPLASVALDLLTEMNCDCRGHSIITSIDSILDGDLSFFSSFDIVVATQIANTRLTRVVAHLCRENIAFVNVKSFGLCGYVRIVCQEHTVTQSHADNDHTDLYIHPSQLTRFPELEKYLSSFDMSITNDHEHAHIPYPAILYWLTRQWIKQYGSLPQSSREIHEFRELIASSAMDINTEQNFQEAKHYYHYAVRNPQLRVAAAVLEVLSHKQAHMISHTSSSSSSFWICVCAINRFISAEGNGFLPVSDNIPDMICDTKSYVKLKNIFTQRAECDVDIVVTHVRKIEEEIHNDSKHQHIERDFIAHFVRNVRYLSVTSMRNFADEFSNDETLVKAIEEYVAEDMMTLNTNTLKDVSISLFAASGLSWYLAIRCAETFFEVHKRYPGDDKDDQLDNDVQEMMLFAHTLCASLKLHHQYSTCGAIEEIVRFGSSMPHTTSAVLGGLASQTILKLITRQYVPNSNTLIWNGSLAVLSSFKM